jgi:hypothetical protein
MQVTVTLHVSFINRSIPCNENHFPVVVLQLSHERKNIMKKTILSIPLVLLLLAGCRKVNNPTVFDLGVDIQSSFENDKVQVFIDNQPLLNTEVTTNQTLSLATSISTANTEGSHTIKVIVNNVVVKTESFTQKADLYIGVNFNKVNSTVGFVFSAHPFGYD